MTKEQIKEKAKDFVSKIASGTSKEMDYYADILVEFATEVTKELEKENAELKEQISTKDILIKELQEQKVYWKNSSFDWRYKFFKLDKDKVKRLVKKDKQLKQAKELLAKWVELFKPKGGNIPPTPIQVETEQFIKDLEK